jgi:hypothetical protein
VSYIRIGVKVVSNDGDAFACTSGPLAFVSNGTYTSSEPTSTSSLPFVRATNQPASAIVGGIIGGVTGFLLLLSIFLHMREGWNETNSTLNRESREEIAGWTSEKLAFLPQSPPKQSGIAILQVPTESDPCDNGENNPSPFLSFRPRRGWISRVLVFLALQIGYLGLLAIACLRPIVLPGVSIAHLTEAKGVTTIFAIAWQTLAIIPIRDIISTIFSSEWSHSFWLTRELTPGKTDRVSIQTAGILDRAKHFCTSNASLAFRLALPASLLAHALVGIAPGALTVNTVFIPTAVRTEVGSIDITKMNDNASPLTGIQGPTILVQMEQIDHGQYGFSTSEPGAFVGWPQQSTLTAAAGNLTYPSDIVRFNYECRWTAPTFLGPFTNESVLHDMSWAVDGKTSLEELWQIVQKTDNLYGGTAAGMCRLISIVPGLT